MTYSTYPTAVPDYLTAQHIQDAIVMWIEDQQPTDDEMVDLSMFVHKQIFEAFGGSVEETGETFIDGTQIIDTVQESDSERLALAKIFKMLCKDFRRSNLDVFDSRSALIANMIEQMNHYLRSDVGQVRSIIRRSLIHLIVLDELRYDNENN